LFSRFFQKHSFKTVEVRVLGGADHDVVALKPNAACQNILSDFFPNLGIF